MNDNSIEYAKMIEIPVCTYEYETRKKRKFFTKKNLIKKANEDIFGDQTALEKSEIECENGADLTYESTTNEPSANDLVLKSDKNSENLDKNQKREKIKSKIITAQVITVFALAVAIILTNIFWENSGMNILFKSVFGGEQTLTDDRLAQDFTLELPAKSEGVSLSDGVLTVNGEYSLYPVCEGTLSKVEQTADGLYTLTIFHSENFSSIIEGADHVYFKEGEKVNKNVPVCHTSTTAKVYLYQNGSLLTDYATVENSIVFNK